MENNNDIVPEGLLLIENENYNNSEDNSQAVLKDTYLVDALSQQNQNITPKTQELEVSLSPLDLEYTFIMEKNILEKNYEPEIKVETRSKSWTETVTEGICNIGSKIADAMSGGFGDNNGDDDDDD